jgi:hypothetical protein
MLKWLLGSKSDNKIAQMLAPGSVGYLSASCCTPSAAIADEQLVRNVQQAMSNLGINVEIQKETLTSAQAGMRSAIAQLSLQQGKVVTKVMALFSTRGFEAFPILFVDGDLAFYGGVPSTEAIEEYFRSRLSRLAAKGAETDREARVANEG